MELEQNKIMKMQENFMKKHPFMDMKMRIIIFNLE